MNLIDLVGNPEVVAIQHDDGTYHPAYVKDAGDLEDYITAHENGITTIGTYVVWGDKARTLVFDIDELDEEWKQRDALRDALSWLGIPRNAVGVEFSGSKGWHLWVVVTDYVPANWLRRIGQAALSSAGIDCEVFPKQDRVRELGNLVKLPNGIHRVTGKANRFITEPVPVGPSLIEALVGRLPEEPKPRRSYGESMVECVSNILGGGAGEGSRNRQLFHLATMMRRNGMSQWVDTVVRATNDTFDPPLGDSEVDALLDSANHSGPICRDLPEEVRCADCPILADRGLSTRQGQLRNGTEGELVVVKIGTKRANGLVELEHPDLDRGLIKVRPPSG